MMLGFESGFLVEADLFLRVDRLAALFFDLPFDLLFDLAFDFFCSM